MSVTGPSYNINAIQKLSELELQRGFSVEASWHNKYKNSCYVFVGGLPYRMNEGDLATVFSQWGELVDIHLVRDKKTGASRGFAFIGYENQKSTILAVDNFNGYDLLGRRLRVDHCESFRAPKDSKKNPTSDDAEVPPYAPTGAEGAGYGVCGVTKVMKNVLETHEAAIEKKRTIAPATFDPDEKWAAEFEAMLAQDTDNIEKNAADSKHALKAEPLPGDFGNAAPSSRSHKRQSVGRSKDTAQQEQQRRCSLDYRSRYQSPERYEKRRMRYNSPRTTRYDSRDCDRSPRRRQKPHYSSKHGSPNSEQSSKRHSSRQYFSPSRRY